jgi:hypothetical protein
MFDIRKIVIVILIAVLFSVFVFSSIEAVYPSPNWGDYCDNNRVKVPFQGERNCTPIDVPDEAYDTCEGNIDFRYQNGCATEYFCNTCSVELEAAQEMHDNVTFFISAFLALIAIFVGLYLPAKENTLNEWIGTGFLLGGAFVLIFGTIQGYGSLHRWLKPVIMLAELLLVIFLAYKKVKNLK